MLSDTHRTQVLAATPPAKAERKVTNTWQGLILVVLGASFALGSFVITGVLLARDAIEINLWVVLLCGGPMVVGLIVIGYGATRWSGEYVGAALKDLRETAVGIIRARKGA